MKELWPPEENRYNIFIKWPIKVAVTLTTVKTTNFKIF